MPYVVKNDLHGSASDLGVVLAAGGVGALSRRGDMGQRGDPRRPVTFMYACWTVATLAVVGYGLGRTMPQLALACLVFNALEAAGTIVWATIKQRHVPAHLLGRVSSLDWLISISLLPVSYALTGPVAAALGARDDARHRRRWSARSRPRRVLPARDARDRLRRHEHGAAARVVGERRRADPQHGERCCRRTRRCRRRRRRVVDLDQR